ncbi:hypothetical protein CPC08DRAFT_715368 [Agrocybe pediades]|nr:hypothetical protein CPC08DRAFT_715368 [Agrocybe pediades]
MSENIPISQQRENLRNALRSRAEFEAECSSPYRRRVPPPRPETPTRVRHHQVRLREHELLCAKLNAKSEK